MSLITIEPRGLGAASLPYASHTYPVLSPSDGGGGGGTAESSFFDSWGVPLAAGAGGLAVGVALAMLAKRVKRKRGR